MCCSSSIYKVCPPVLPFNIVSSFIMELYVPTGLLVILLSVLSSDARNLNITNLENCQDLPQAVVHLTTIDYHMVNGLCNTVHGEMTVTAADYKPRNLTMTLFKCANTDETEPCLENPMVHEEHLGCERLIGDDSGPWAMFSDAVARSNCGKNEGVYSVDYSTLKLEHLINYLNIHDEDYSRFRLRMHFLSMQTNSLRACLDLDFKLLL